MCCMLCFDWEDGIFCIWGGFKKKKKKTVVSWLEELLEEKSGEHRVPKVIHCQVLCLGVRCLGTSLG